MNILVIGTIAGRTDRLAAVLDYAHNARVEAIFVLGNLLEPANTSATHADYLPIITQLATLNVPVYVVPGAHDASIATLDRAIREYHGPTHIYLIHRTAAPLGSTDVVAGFGGLLTLGMGETSAALQFPVWEARVAFEHLHAYDTLFKTSRRRILLFATPPQGQRVDHENGTATGMPLLNTLIRAHGPHLVCCSGPANGRGVELVNGTQVVNPGSLADGSFALIDIDQLSVQLHRLPEPLAIHPGFRSIVVAIDGSAESWRALELAASMAQRDRARLTLVYAWEPVHPSLRISDNETEAARRIAAGEEMLAEAARYIVELNPEQDVLEGPAATAILRAAEAREADLIVMGARGLGSLRSALGSVSRRVLQRAHCPILIAREQPQTAALADRAALQTTDLH